MHGNIIASYASIAITLILLHKYFIIGNKKELNKLCTSLINFEITVEDILLKSQNPQEIQESQITPSSKPSDAEKKTQLKKKMAKVKLYWS